MSRWFAGAIIYRKNDAGEYELLVMDCKSLDPKYAHHRKQTKFPGGTDGDHPEDKDIFHTLRRELIEETDLELKERVTVRLIHSEQPHPDHFKSFYLIPLTDCEGEVRAEEKTMGYDWMGPPYWVKAHESGRLLYRSHQDALLQALRRLEPR